MTARPKIDMTSTPTPSPRAAIAIAALHTAAIMFVMDAMLGQQRAQLKMPRLDAYWPAGSVASNPSVERTANGGLRRFASAASSTPLSAAHLQR
jgi:hypothetical protein